ncbi:MAG: PhnD/SsuA/transferrin family substrate-binding protein [Burkholderiales bacterium]|nr:PhnD/SsuA/transferrin family substrate-binding protein [Burkholderiales bacterium]
MERARKGNFDIVGASPHVLRILQRRRFEPLARATAALEPLVVVNKDTTAEHAVSDLRGQRVMVADFLALHVLIALRALRDAGLNPAKDLNLTLAGNQRNAIARMLKGEAVAAVASASTVASLPPELAQNVACYCAPKGLLPWVLRGAPAPAQPRARAAQVHFANAAHCPGAGNAKATQQENYVALTPADLASQDTVVTEFYASVRYRVRHDAGRSGRAAKAACTTGLCYLTASRRWLHQRLAPIISPFNQNVSTLHRHRLARVWAGSWVR